MSRKCESSGTGKRKNRAYPRRQKNDERALMDAFDGEYAKLIDDIKKGVPFANFE
jgi:hypothetical protein